MKHSQILFAVAVVTLVWVCSADSKDDKVKKLQIGIKKRKTCPVASKSKKGDTLHMKYRGTLHKTGEEFDSTASRNDEPFVFTLGTGQVIKGWDQGLLGMCEGEERKLVVPPDMGYGARGAPPKIPPNAALVFEVTLEKITRHDEF